MKRIFAALLLAVTLLTLVACANTDETPDGMKDVAIESADYHLYVPEVWIEANTLGISGAHAGAANEQFSPNVIVTVYYPDVATDVATYWQEKASPELSLTHKELSMVETAKAATLGGKDAAVYTYTYTLGGTAYKQMQVITVRDYRIYSLIYTATADLYDTYVGEVDSIVAAFTFK